MSERPAPTVANDLTLRPAERDCIGEKCPIRAKEGLCYVSRHHLYWPKIVYLDESPLAFQFRNDRHNIVPMAHCRHNGSWKRNIHNRFGYAPIPSDDVMMTFLDESKILEQCGATATDMETIVNLIIQEQELGATIRADRQDKYESTFERLTVLGRQLLQFDILTMDIVGEWIEPQIPTLRYVLAPNEIGQLALR